MRRPGLGAAIAGAVLGAALFAAAAAEATVLYQRAPAGTTNTPAARSAGDRTAYDDFSLSDQAQVTSIDWIGFSGPGSEFQIGIYASVPGVPISVPAATPLFQVTVTPTVTPDADFSFVRHFAADLGTSFLLEADTLYWLAIRNVTPGGSFWGWNGDGGGISISQGPNGYGFNAISLFFTLNGEFVTDVVAVSEPATLSLFAAGLLGLAMVRRRTCRPLPPR